MKEQQAKEFLMELGWNKYGAKAIVDEIIQEGNLADMTFEELKKISDDYSHR